MIAGSIKDHQQKSAGQKKKKKKAEYITCCNKGKYHLDRILVVSYKGKVKGRYL